MLESTIFNAIRISLASPDQIRDWSSGEVTKPETIKLPHPEAGEGRPLRRAHLRSDEGLECYCGQVQADPYKGIICRQVRG